MTARVPLDVDLEDRLVFGLTPARFGYLAVAAIAAFSIWSHSSIPAVVRLPSVTLLTALGGGLAWGRWNGRALDGLALDALAYLRRNYRIELHPGILPAGWCAVWPTDWDPRPRLAGLGLARRTQPPVVAVAGLSPGVGGTRVAVELSAALAATGRRVALHEVGPRPGDAARALGMSGPGRHRETGLEVSAQVPGGAPRHPRLLVLDVGARHVSPPPDLTLLVTAGDVPDPAQLRMATAARSGATAVVVNRHLGGGVRARSDDDPDTEVIALIPEDPAVRDAEAGGRAAVLAFPGAPAAVAFQRLAESVIDLAGSPRPA